VRPLTRPLTNDEEFDSQMYFERDEGLNT